MTRPPARAMMARGYNMREIKFRGWNKYWGVFHYATMSQLLDKDIGPDICELSNYSENPEVEQFTGMHDKNGKEIYEGDIVRFDVVASERGPERLGQTGIV